MNHNEKLKKKETEEKKLLEGENKWNNQNNENNQINENNQNNQNYKNNQNYQNYQNNQNNQIKENNQNNENNQNKESNQNKENKNNKENEENNKLNNEVKNTEINNKNYKDYLLDNNIKGSFPLFQRFKFNLKKCTSKNYSYYDLINENFKSFKYEKDNKLLKKIIKLKILETSSIKYDYNFSNPFVRFHFINPKNGKYIEKINEENGFYQFENQIKYDKYGIKLEEEIKFIPPMATNSYFLNNTIKNKFVFNEEFEINYLITDFLDNESIILFEILDYNYKFLYENRHKVNKEGLYKIAWGYLRPLGENQIHFGNVNIKLFDFQVNSQKLNSENYNIPEVYFDFIWPYKRENNSYLTIFFESTIKNEYDYVNYNPTHFYEKDKLEEIDISNKNEDLNLEIEEEKKEDEEDETKNNIKKYLRAENDACKVPTTVVNKISSYNNKYGCNVVKFSNNGKFLACSFISKDNVSEILIYNLEEMEEYIIFKGHNDLVHSIDFSENDRKLLSCSSDFSFKLWYIPEFKPTEYSSDDYLLNSIILISFIFDIKFCLKDSLILTASYDGYINLFYLENEDNSIKKIKEYKINNAFPNCIELYDKGKLYIGDSNGNIHIWQLNSSKPYSISRIRSFTNSELSGVLINNIVLFKEKGNICVQTRDNCIRLIDENKVSIIHKYIGLKNKKNNIRFSISPDYQFLISGSEDGSIKLWDILSGVDINNELDFKIKGKILSTDWNKKYNLVAVSGYGDSFPVIIFN